MTAKALHVDFYFDPISPYAWLAGCQLDRLDTAGVAVDFRPVLFAGLLNAHGNVGPAEVLAKRAHLMRDVARVAARLGLKFEGPPTHPFNPLRALRMCIAIDEPAQRRRFGLALMDAAWARGLDPADDAVLQQLAGECELDGQALVAKSGRPEIKQRLIDATQAAIKAGVFGVPTFVYEQEIFWGSDRLDDLLRRLQGHQIDEAHVARMLARPASAQRKTG